MTENTVRIDDRRFQLSEIPSQLCFSFEDETDPDWSWIEDDEHFTGEWGAFGPIDVDGHQYTALVILVERVWDDGYTETVDSLGEVVVDVDDSTLASGGITKDGPWSVADIILWLDRFAEGTGRHYLAVTALEMTDDAELPDACPYGCATPAMDRRDLVYHMGWHRAERAREARPGKR